MVRHLMKQRNESTIEIHTENEKAKKKKLFQNINLTSTVCLTKINLVSFDAWTLIGIERSRNGISLMVIIIHLKWVRKVKLLFQPKTVLIYSNGYDIAKQSVDYSKKCESPLVVLIQFPA